MTDINTARTAQRTKYLAYLHKSGEKLKVVPAWIHELRMTGAVNITEDQRIEITEMGYDVLGLDKPEEAKPTGPFQRRNDEERYVDHLNREGPVIYHAPNGPVVILLDPTTRETVGYRVYMPHHNPHGNYIPKTGVAPKTPPPAPRK